MPTALELKPDELKPYIDEAKTRYKQVALSPAKIAERETLFKKIYEIADILRSHYGAKKVILFGSLAHERWFDEYSDVDIAVDGLKGSDYWLAWREIQEVLKNRKIDLIDIETVSKSFQHAIESKGIKI